MDVHLLIDEPPLLPPYGGKQPRSMATAFAVFMAKAFFVCLGLLLLYVFAHRVYVIYDYRPPEFSVMINGFSGLDDRAPREFSLTVGIDNLGGMHLDACVGGEAVVLYGGVPLAVGNVQELCVPGNRAADVAIVAASGGVGLPEALAELMAGEKRADGAAHVEVRLMMLEHTRFLSCTAPLDDNEESARAYPCRVAHLVDESDGVRPDGINDAPGGPL
jgi:hypothetical protein